MPDSDHPADHPSPADGPAMSHTGRRLLGRDPHEQHRTATPLELLFDLTFVVAFGQAASLFAHSLAAGHTGSGLMSFLFAVFAVCWAWINFAWFASAFDNDDWIFRTLVMLQMVGVIILALGLPALFHGIEGGQHIGAGVIVLGYVVMRVPMIVQWLRAAKHNPGNRPAAMSFVRTLAISQIGWVALALADPPVSIWFVGWFVLIVVEMIGPLKAERQGDGTPWHAHHISERYGLLAIICLGEGIVGTVASLSAVIGTQGWSVDAVLIALSGTGLTFGMWWIYYTIPSGPVLHAHRERGLLWGYLHIFVFGAIVAVGAGLDVAAYFIQGESSVSGSGAALAVIIPVGIYVLMIFVLYSHLVRGIDVFQIGLIAGSLVLLVTAATMSAAGISMPVCLLVVMLVPVVTVVGYETVGSKHTAAALRQAIGTD